MRWLVLVCVLSLCCLVGSDLILTPKEDNENNNDENTKDAKDENKKKETEEVKLDPLALSTKFLDDFKPEWLEALLAAPPDKYVPSDEDAEALYNQLPPPPEEEDDWLKPHWDIAVSYFNAGLQELKDSKKNNKKFAYSVLQSAADLGHNEAKIYIAWGNLLGNGIPQDINAARKLFEEVAETGNADGHTGLGFLYATGIAVNVSQPRALLHYTMGATGGNKFAKQILGYRHWAGITTPASCEKALDFYRDVAAQVASEVTFSGGPAIQRIRLLDETENSALSSGVLDNDLIEYYQMLAEKGDIPAQVGLGQLHYQGGRGVPLDLQKALHYFTQAAKAGNAVAMAFLGKIYLEGGDGIKADNETAFTYFKKAAELNNPLGQSGLGLMYLQGRGVPQNIDKARHYFTLSADQGWVDGQLQLANMFFGGIGVRRDFKMANKYYSLASQSGHVLAYYHLAQMHAQGMGTFRSCTTAVELLKNVCERGKWSSRLMEAHSLYKSGHIDSAYVQYAFMAELGYEVAQSNAAYLLDSGEVKMFSPPEVYERALQYWARAASQGYSPARVKLGDYHYYGLGTSADFEAAASHYRIASEQQHNAQATFNLGFMHERGLGLAKDWHLAKRCYDLAAEQSPHARVPAALALAYLNFHLAIDSLQQSPLASIFLSGESTILMNWDLYMILALLGALALTVMLRRPPPAQPANW